MSTLAKLVSKATRTLVGTDIIRVQDTAGATNYKTTLTALKTFLYNLFLSSSNTWSGANDFTTGSIEVPDGSTTHQAVSKQQLDTKEDASTGTKNY